MRSSTVGLVALVGAVGIGMTAPRAARAVETPPAPDAAKEAMTAQWQQLAAPGEPHKRLEPLIGKWKHTVKWRMSPDATPEESQGTNENRWIFGNRFVHQDAKGQAMGQPFEGIGITGYDNMRGEYTSVWLDNMGTGIMTSTAQYDPASGAFKESGSFACPMTGEAHRPFRAVWTVLDNSHYTYEMYTLDKDGKEFKSMEALYERL